MSKERNDSWSGRWVQRKINGHDKVSSTELIGSNFLFVTNDDACRFQIATMSQDRIYAKDLDGLLEGEDVDFVLNVSKEPFISGDALKFAENNNFAIGGLGDLMRAVGGCDLSSYVNPETAFILRGLRQHTRVINVECLDNRRYQIERTGLSTVTIVALNEYDLTAETVRSAIDKFPGFDAILTSNPNCRRSSNSVMVAESAGIKILSWGELLGDLNRQWS